jgi:tryptophan-rich sensory protein
MHIWQNREDSEHEQAIIRILVGLLAAVYLLTVLLIPEKPPQHSSLLLLPYLFFIRRKCQILRILVAQDLVLQ